MSKHEQSREKWEQEFRDLQEHVLEEDRWRNCDTLLNRAQSSLPLLSKAQFYFVVALSLLIALGFCWYFRL